ncbi:hypothetical protein [Nitrosopumilus sp.]|uniref:hypothetical protein n=1 Tax=Nitrosopumilus sp. TaxID=2024843 RepID=UPI0026266449|nr:hypothetical protein [Nitrosopumilus sp.]
MVSILPVAIVVAVGAALFGSMAFQSLQPAQEVILSPLEQKCQQIANEGYKIHALYPNANPEDLPETEMKRMLYLDEQWMTQCVAVLPSESIFNIANNVERDLSLGE